jgi:plasmid stabilization system protein ParE
MGFVKRRPLAQRDVNEIWDFIADDSVTGADAFMDRLEAAFNCCPPSR